MAGFDTLDVVSRPKLTYSAKLGWEKLPIPDAAYDEVYASHVLEHVPWTRTQAALGEIRRILRPGGTFEVWVPNFGYIIECYRKKKCGDKWRRNNPNNDWMTWVNGRIFTYGPGEENFHRACFDPPFMRSQLQQAGFAAVTHLTERTRGTSHGAIDMGFSAVRKK